MHRLVRSLILRLVPGLILALPMHALAQESAERGGAIAKRWCAECHVVSADQEQASADAPPFMSIAERSEGAFGWLAAFLAEPHPVMPEMSLSRQQIRDLAAYLAALKE